MREKIASSKAVISSRSIDDAVAKYTRGPINFNTKNVKHKHLRKTMEETKEKIKNAASITAAAEILLPSDAGFIEPENNVKVFKLKQKQILQNVDLNTNRNAFDFQLTNFGPYAIDYSRNGRYICIILIIFRLLNILLS
jgi:U3 small nucleolar RNA-associated protein 7